MSGIYILSLHYFSEFMYTLDFDKLSYLIIGEELFAALYNYFRVTSYTCAQV